MESFCFIGNYAPHYRANIYSTMDKEMNFDFYFGNNIIGNKINKMDYSLLGSFREEVMNYRVLKTHFYYQRGVVKLLKEDYSVYLMTGEPYCLSTWIFLLLARLHPQKKVYLWTHGWYGDENWLKMLAKKLFFKMAYGIFLYGNFAKDLMIRQGFSSERLFVIHNSLDYETQLSLRLKICESNVYRAYFGNDFPKLIFIGRLNKEKKIVDLMYSIKILKEKNEMYNLILIGDGEELTALRLLAVELDIEKQIWFYGSCYNELENANLIYNADLCVSPGNVGLTAVHSMMFGTPVLTHDNFHKQMPEYETIKEGITGSFFHYNDINSLALEITHWFSVNRDREQIRENCFNEIDEYWTPAFQMRVLKQNLK